MRTVRQSAIELLRASEAMPQGRFQFGALLFCHSRKRLLGRFERARRLLLGLFDHLLATILEAAGDLRALLE